MRQVSKSECPTIPLPYPHCISIWEGTFCISPVGCNFTYAMWNAADPKTRSTRAKRV